jgi:hypothetical protein
MIKYNGLNYIKENFQYFNKYYRGLLSEFEQEQYDKIVLSLIEYSNLITYKGLSANQIEDIFNKIKLDFPLLFYVDSLEIKYEQLSKVGVIIPKYRFAKGKANDTIVAILYEVKKFLNYTINCDELKKEKAVHDYLCSTVVYDYNFSDSSYECVGPLLFKKGVCEGISKAAKLLFDIIGVNCIIVHGDAIQLDNQVFKSERHAWNIVRIFNSFYHLDITFDLTLKQNYLIRYDYFNLSDFEISKEHKMQPLFLPKCHNNLNYYTNNKDYFTSDDELMNYFLNKIKSGKKSFVFKTRDYQSIEEAEKSVFHALNCALQKLNFYNQKFQYSCNSFQWVFQVSLL